MDNPSPSSPSPGPSASMANRGRYNSFSSKAGNVMDNSPRRIRKRREPTPFNLLIIGAKNCGKSSFLNLLRSSLAPDSHDGKSGRKNGRNAEKEGAAQDEEQSTASVSNRRLLTFSSQYVESKIENEDFGITIWDSEGLVESMIDLQLRDIVTFLESKFEETFDEEVKLVRDPGARDSQIHCVFYLLDPVRIELNMAATSSRKATVLGSGCDLTTSSTTTTTMMLMMEGGVAAAPPPAAQRGEAHAFLGGLDAKFDLQALQMLCEKTTVIPVISKADTVTLAQMSYLKWAVWESIRANGLDPFDIINRNSPDNASSPKSRPPSSPGSFSECRSYSVGDDDNDNDDDDDDDEVMMMKNRAVGKRQSSRNDGKGKNSSKTMKSSSSPSSPLSSSSFSSSSATSTPSGTEAGDVNNNKGTLAKHHRLHEPPNSTTTYTTTTRPPPPMLPLSIISPDKTYNQGFPGREFPWGAAQTDNPLHCNFSKLKELVFVEWRDEMREASRVLWYERWRTARLGRWKNNDSSMMRVEIGNNNSSSRSQIQHHHQHQHQQHLH